MRRAIDLVHYVVKDGILNNDSNEVVRPSISSNNVSGNQRSKEVHTKKFSVLFWFFYNWTAHIGYISETFLA